jgi:putative ABC transport system ATP-binding protein
VQQLHRRQRRQHEHGDRQRELTLPADPTIIVADEPTGDLDRVTAEEILGLLTGLNRELGKTIIMVTHDPKAAGHAARMIHLEKGVLVV